ncbi:MAG: glycosyltransferase family 2 protein [Firmicutes bacterium]|nr:glycosyltransferase family 2 protein [Bacillota bacterium]
MKKVDLIVPCYNEEQVLNLFYDEAKKVTSGISGYEFTFIFIDDGSKDKTPEILEGFAQKYKDVKYISFSRNFGKESAMYAGLKNSTGDYMLVLDADLQHPPKLIIPMLQAMEEGYDCCAANRATRDGDPPMRTFFTRRFYRLVNKISEVDMPDGAGDFRMMNRPMVNAVIAMSEVQRFSKGIFSWVGFKTKWIDFENVERAAGETKWSFWKLFSYAIDGITAFSTFPLKVSSYMGLLTAASAFVYLIYIIVKTLIFGKDLPGYASTVTLILFVGGMLLMACGVLGEYIAKIYLEVKNRPVYIIRKTNVDEPKDDFRS